MKYQWWVGLLVLTLAAGCEQAVKDAQKAADDAAAQAAADAKARVDAAGAEAKAAVEEAGAEAKAAVESAGAEAKQAVEGTGADVKSALEGALGDLGSLKVGDVDVTKEAGTIAKNLSTTLAEIKDVDTAKAALPKLEEANLGLDKLVGAVNKIPEASRPAIASLLKTHKATIQATIEKVEAIEGVGEIVKPVLDEIVAKLDKVSGASNSAEPEAKPAPAP